MIITFSTQKGGTGKTTLAIAFSNYISSITKRDVHVYDYDYQKSFFTKWQQDADTALPPLYNVHPVNDEVLFSSTEDIMKLKSDSAVHIFDLAGTLDARYSDLLVYSDFIIIPFEYSDVSSKSTLVFINLLGMLESMALRIFIKSRYDKGFKYPNQAGMDAQVERFGHLISAPVYKRNSLQVINTRELTVNQKEAVKTVFDEVISIINENSETTF